MYQKLLIPIIIMTILSSCESQDSYNITDPFPYDESTSLVIYAAKSLDDVPDKSLPNLIFHEYDIDSSGIISDGAPHFSIADAKDMLEEIHRWKEKPSNDQDFKQALISEEWVKVKMSEGWTHFLFETEPPKYAGNAYPWADYAENH